MVTLAPRCPQRTACAPIREGVCAAHTWATDDVVGESQTPSTRPRPTRTAITFDWGPPCSPTRPASSTRTARSRSRGSFTGSTQPREPPRPSPQPAAFPQRDGRSVNLTRRYSIAPSTATPAPNARVRLPPAFNIPMHPPHHPNPTGPHTPTRNRKCGQDFARPHTPTSSHGLAAPDPTPTGSTHTQHKERKPIPEKPPDRWGAADHKPDTNVNVRTRKQICAHHAEWEQTDMGTPGARSRSHAPSGSDGSNRKRAVRKRPFTCDIR